MKRLFPHFLAYTMPLLAFWGISMGGLWIYSGFFFAFFIHPLLDFIFGKSEHVEVRKVEYQLIYNLLTWVYLPIQLILFHLIFINHLKSGPTFFELFGIALSLGTISGAIGITLAHELIHRRHPIERGLGISLLLMVNYAHFRIEHVYGHHKHVGTPRDPATARRGENLYLFWIRSIIGGWLSAFNIERHRLGKRSFIFNRIFIYTFLQLCLSVLIYFYYGETSLIVFMIQSFVAIITLETVNFIEHYGLERKEISHGKYEPVTALHSWDSRQKMTNWFLFNLGKHAHHHFSPTVPYEELETKISHRELKYGYSTHMVLAFFGNYPKSND